jgi:hypothetical protein
MAESKIKYATPATITMGLASLAASTTLTVGRQSVEQSNTSTNYVDVLVQGRFRTGATVAVGNPLAVYVWGSDTAPSATAIDGISGADAAVTLTNAGTRDALVKLAAGWTATATTANQNYWVGPFSVAQLFGGSMPRFWGLIVTHNMGSSLNASDNTDQFTFTGVTYETV